MSVRSTELINYCLHTIGTAFSVHYTESEGAHILESYKVEIQSESYFVQFSTTENVCLLSVK